MNAYKLLGCSFALPLLGAILLLAACLAASAALAAEPAKPGPSVDDELLKDLNTKMSDDLDGQLPGPEQKKAAKPGESKPASAAGQGRGGEKPEPVQPPRDLGQAAVSGEENPLIEIAQQMQLAGMFLGRAQSGEKTQQVQADIVEQLNKLIKKSCSGAGQCQPSQSKSPKVAERKSPSQPKTPSKPSSKPGQNASKPAKNSQAATGKPGASRPSTEEMIAVLKQHWGELPEHAREQMLQGMGSEEFLPKYEALIEEYYKRLAEGEER